MKGIDTLFLNFEAIYTNIYVEYLFFYITGVVVYYFIYAFIFKLIEKHIYIHIKKYLDEDEKTLKFLNLINLSLLDSVILGGYSGIIILLLIKNYNHKYFLINKYSFTILLIYFVIVLISTSTKFIITNKKLIYFCPLYLLNKKPKLIKSIYLNEIENIMIIKSYFTKSLIINKKDNLKFKISGIKKIENIKSEIESLINKLTESILN